MTRIPHILIAALAALTLMSALTACAAQAAPPDAVRVGGPSAPADSKIAIVGSATRLAGKRFTVVDPGGKTVLSGKLTASPGTPAPWKFASRADLSKITTPGSYKVRVGRLTSRAWVVKTGAQTAPILTMLQYFTTQSDGNEPAGGRGPAHLNDGIIANGPFQGQKFDLTGGWMDAGDTLKFMNTTAYAAMALQAAARLDPADSAALNNAADVGIRWILKAHPAPGLFIGQVGDARDHDLGFRDPTTDDASGKPGIAERLAFPNMGGDIGGKAAAALALAADRTPPGEARDRLIQQAREWYDAGEAADKPAPKLPAPAGDFYIADRFEDAMAAGAAALYRATGEQQYVADAIDWLAGYDPDGSLSWNGVAGFAAADLCGVLGAPGAADEAARARACDHLGAHGRLAATRSRKLAFGTPGTLGWGTTGENASGALAVLAERAGKLPGGRAVGAGARDWLLGRNAWDSSFITGFGPRSPRNPHHWASVFGKGLPKGAVVGGPADLKSIREQGPDIGGFKPGKFDAPVAAYEDRIDDYVTSEPAIDYTAGSILLLAAVGS